MEGKHSKYRLGKHNNYTKSYLSLHKKHYSKNNRGQKKLDSIINKLIELLSINPRPPVPIARRVIPEIKKLEREPYPAKVSKHLELWKLYFKMPDLKKGASHGRIMFLINEQEKTVVLFWIYTHSEYSGRPSEKELRKIINTVLARSD